MGGVQRGVQDQGILAEAQDILGDPSKANEQHNDEREDTRIID